MKAKKTTRRIVSTKVNRRNAEHIELEPLSVTDDEEDVSVHGLFARNLCPRCPRNASVLPAGGKTSGGSGFRFCCSRKTVTKTRKTLWRTRIVTRTPNSAVSCEDCRANALSTDLEVTIVDIHLIQPRVTMTGRVWYG